ncbi:hypothetical protein OCU04_003943 [Sclerotinia nivalis]|uniref:Uncharacterized protein n=1 Tax=Sclerotinia nivalis TaxID=352851 RepID=A0A9X0AWF2_9HELO|nr:hypothetical protein OCU04_003943 [Sclerotinia nivalis]
MQPSERKNAFEKLQKEHKAFERGEAKKQLSDIPANKIIVLDDDGIVQRPVGPRSLVSIKRETRALREAVKQEVIDLGRGEQARDRTRMTIKRGIKEEPIELDDFPFASTIRRPPVKKLRIQQETIDVDAIEHTNIKQEVIDVDAIADNTIVLEKEATIKYDLTEIDDDILTTPLPIPIVKDEDSNDINTMEEVLPFVEEADRKEFDFLI